MNSPAHISDKPQLPGKPIAVLLLTLIIFGVGFAMYRFYTTRSPQGEVQAVFAIDDRALIFRDSDLPDFQVEMVLADRSEGPQWRKGIYALQLDTTRGVTVDGDFITVRAMDVDGHLETHTFGLDTGEFKWRRRAFESVPEGWQDGARSFASDGVVYEFYGGEQSAIIAYQVENGEEHCRAELGDLTESAPRVSEGTVPAEQFHLLVHTSANVRRVDGECNITELLSEPGCVVGGPASGEYRTHLGSGFVGCAVAGAESEHLMALTNHSFVFRDGNGNDEEQELNSNFVQGLAQSGMWDRQLPSHFPLWLESGRLLILRPERRGVRDRRSASGGPHRSWHAASGRTQPSSARRQQHRRTGGSGPSPALGTHHAPAHAGGGG